MIRHASLHEKELLISTLNTAFSDVRSSDFSIRQQQPRAYGEGINRAAEHLLEERDGKIVSILGNLQETLQVGNESYRFATIGSVATLPSYRHRGIMRSLMEEAHQENKKNGEIFAILTGNPAVYHSLGFVPGPVNLLFTFPASTKKYPEYSARPMGEEDIDFAYALYRSSVPYRIRRPETFLVALGSHGSKAVVFYQGSKRIGYAAFNERYGNELCLNDPSHREAALSLLPSSLEWVFTPDDIASLRYAYEKGLTPRIWQREMLHIYQPEAFLKLLHQKNGANLERDEMALQVATQSGHFDSNAFVTSLFPPLGEEGITLSSHAYTFEIPWCDLFW